MKVQHVPYLCVRTCVCGSSRRACAYLVYTHANLLGTDVYTLRACVHTYVRTYVQVLSSTYVGLFQGSGNENYPYRCGCATHMGTGIAWWCQPFCSNQKVEQRPIASDIVCEFQLVLETGMSFWCI